jgi:hypothetical protein
MTSVVEPRGQCSTRSRTLGLDEFVGRMVGSVLLDGVLGRAMVRYGRVVLHLRERVS